MEVNILFDFLLALGIGAIIGLEREIQQQHEKEKDFAGIRTFILISILGFLSAFISIRLFDSIITFIIAFAVFALFISTAYVILALKKGKFGTTTEIAAFIAFLLSAAVAFDITNNMKLVAVGVAVIVASLLVLKRKLHKFAGGIKIVEVYAAIKMAVISIIILPLLPNYNYTLLEIPIVDKIVGLFPKIIPIVEQLDVFNPFKIWLMVVFITGLSFIGYILIKSIGMNKGIKLTSILGALVSSTAVTVSLSDKSKGKKVYTPFVIGIVLASSIMFVRVLIEIIVVNPSLFHLALIPIGGMAITGLLVSFLFSKFMKQEKDERIDLKSPFAIGPGIKFGLFFAFILVISKLLFILFGNSGIFIAALVSGLADVDAITLTLASLAAGGTVSAVVAVLGITIAVASNTVVKAGIAMVMADKRVGKWVAIIFALILAVGLGVLLFL
ncbi:MAG: MgtC/SapB family protein [Nanoarchaeota archaeon]|nr:MgtC/SapB family protein [Nanoarchaeota archaeon]